MLLPILELVAGLGFLVAGGLNLRQRRMISGLLFLAAGIIFIAVSVARLIHPG